MKQTIKTITMLIVAVLILSSCGKSYYVIPYYVVVETEDGVKYSITHPTEIKYKKVEYIKSQTLAGKKYFYNLILSSTPEDKLRIEEIEYTITAENNDNRETPITVYIIKEPNIPHPFVSQGTDLTEEMLEWAQENHTVKYTLTKDEQSKTIGVKL